MFSILVASLAAFLRTITLNKINNRYCLAVLKEVLFDKYLCYEGDDGGIGGSGVHTVVR